MKFFFYLIPVLIISFSCSGEKKQTEDSSVAPQNSIEMIEKTTEETDESKNITDSEIEKKQIEIDSLLNNL